jgi:hypothetical protein
MYVAINLAGTDMDKTWAVVYSEFFFSHTLKLQEIMSAIHNFDERKFWDEDVLNGEVLDVREENKVMLWYQKN